MPGAGQGRVGQGCVVYLPVGQVGRLAAAAAAAVVVVVVVVVVYAPTVRADAWERQQQQHFTFCAEGRYLQRPADHNRRRHWLRVSANRMRENTRCAALRCVWSENYDKINTTNYFVQTREKHKLHKIHNTCKSQRNTPTPMTYKKKY